jgi:ParB family chromosome partitioning protein
MASAAVAPVVPDRPSPVSDDAFRLVPWASCVASPLNPRKHFDPDGLKELAGTMGSDVGVIEPLVVRPSKNTGQFEIVAGERRWRAAELAGLTQVPVIVREGLTDVQVLRMMVIENKQRKDLNALEEGEGFYQLTKRGVDIDSIAADIKLSRRYVYDRLKLLADLSETGKQLLLSERISAGHGILLSRLTAKQQAEALKPNAYALFDYDDDGEVSDGDLPADQRIAPAPEKKRDPYAGRKVVSVRQLANWIGENCRLDLDAPTTHDLFPETTAAISSAKERAEEVVHVTTDYMNNADAKQDKVLPQSAWKRADGKEHSKRCDRSVTGVVVLGSERGSAFKVCVDRECETHWPKAERPKSTTRPTSRGSTVDYQKTWREEEERRNRERAHYKSARKAILEAFTARVRKVSIAALADFLAKELRAPVSGGQKLFGEVKTGDDALRALALGVIANFNEYEAPHALPAAAKRFGVDLKPALKSVQTSAQTEGASKKKSPAKKASKKKR